MNPTEIAETVAVFCAGSTLAGVFGYAGVRLGQAAGRWLGL